jgi:hypothetical protein
MYASNYNYLAKRAKLTLKLKELIEKSEEIYFTYNDSLEEVFENKEQIGSI